MYLDNIFRGTEPHVSLKLIIVKVFEGWPMVFLGKNSDFC